MLNTRDGIQAVLVNQEEVNDMLDISEFVNDIRKAETVHNKALSDMAINFPKVNIIVHTIDHLITYSHLSCVAIKTKLTQEL